MSIATGLPLWAIALAFAVLAPFAARALASWFEERVRARSRRVLDVAAKESPASSVDRRE